MEAGASVSGPGRQQRGSLFVDAPYGGIRSVWWGWAQPWERLPDPTSKTARPAFGKAEDFFPMLLGSTEAAGRAAFLAR
jgi:hypothetical protein